MESIEQTGRTVDEAVEAALRALGVTRNEVDVEVLAEESRGLLGILGYSSARVRVTVKERPAEHEAVRAEADEARAEGDDVRAEADEARAEADEARAHEFQPSVAAVEERSDLAKRSVEILTRVIGLMGLEGEVEVTSEDEQSVAVNIHSEEDLGLLIGRRGQTLAALQLIVAMMANRGLPPDLRRRVLLDAAGYRARRERTLQTMARSAAQRARRSGRPVTLNSLNARERRVIHLALADDPSVTTRSEGEDPDRSIIITARRRTR